MNCVTLFILTGQQKVISGPYLAPGPLSADPWPIITRFWSNKNFMLLYKCCCLFFFFDSTGHVRLYSPIFVGSNHVIT